MKTHIIAGTKTLGWLLLFSALSYSVVSARLLDKFLTLIIGG